MRLLALFALFATSLLSAQDRVVINDSVDAELQKGIIPVSVVSDDQVLGNLVQFALSTHGAISLRAGSSVKVVISRSGLTATVACDNARFAFQTSVEGKDEDELALRTADAALVGLGKRWQLKPLFAGTKIAFTSKFSGNQEIYVTNLARSKTRMAALCSSLNSIPSSRRRSSMVNDDEPADGSGVTGLPRVPHPAPGR